VAPSRTAYNAPIRADRSASELVRAFRFYEWRLYGGEIEYSGMCILGRPLPSMGHSKWCSVAMTTGGPEHTDVYEEELSPRIPRQVAMTQWVDMQVRTEVIKVKDKDGVKEQKVEKSNTPATARSWPQGWAKGVHVQDPLLRRSVAARPGLQDDDRP